MHCEKCKTYIGKCSCSDSEKIKWRNGITRSTIIDKRLKEILKEIKNHKGIYLDWCDECDKYWVRCKCDKDHE